jgi:hypothetical protein
MELTATEDIGKVLTKKFILIFWWRIYTNWPPA